MSIVLGDINAESLKALATQGGAELDEFVDRIRKMATDAEDHAEVVIDSVESKTQGFVAEDINAILSGLRDLLQPANTAIPQVVALLTEIKERGLMISLPPASK